MTDPEFTSPRDRSRIHLTVLTIRAHLTVVMDPELTLAVVTDPEPTSPRDRSRAHLTDPTDPEPTWSS